MKKLTVLIWFTSLFGYAQIDYKGLVRNLEEITTTTDLKNYFKGLPIENEAGVIAFNDERFLRYYGVTIKKVKLGKYWSGKQMDVTPFDEKEDYFKIKSKLIERYGEPETYDNSSMIIYSWKDDTKEIRLSINIAWEEDDETDDLTQDLKDGKFQSFDELTITFNEH